MTLRNKRPWSLLVGLVAVALIVAACQAAPTGTGGSAAPAADQPDLSGAYHGYISGEPATIDPQKASFVSEVGVVMKVFEALMTPDIKTGKPVPAAAKDQPKVSADGLSYTYTLKDGLKWSDGQPLTVEQYKYGWERLCDPATAGEYAFTGYIVKGCEDWSTSDPKKEDAAKVAAKRDAFLKDGVVTSGNTITFNLKEPAPYFASIASLWVGVPARKDMVDKGGDKWTEPATYVGNGPFVLKDWKHNEKLVFERNDNYRAAPKLKGWTDSIIADNAVAFAAYKSGDIDVYYSTAADLRPIESDPDLSKQAGDFPDGCSFYIGMNNRKAPFDDKSARLAFAKSFDRDSFIKDVQKFGVSSTSFISKGLPGYDEGDTFQKFDVTAAKDLLSKAGPAAQAGLAGVKFTFANVGTNPRNAQWLQQQWKANLGLDVALDPVESKAFSQLVKNKDTVPPLFFLGWCPDYYDQQDWLTTVFESKSTVSHTGFSNPKFDDLVHQADKEPDAKKRDDLYQQASRILSQDAPVAFLFYRTAKILVKPYLKNFVQTPLGFENAIFTDRYVIKH